MNNFQSKFMFIYTQDIFLFDIEGKCKEITEFRLQFLDEYNHSNYIQGGGCNM